ncbi:hypothetical protein [Azohydromonas caseinilytica]|uniref:Uncharacterized protein n=1 Tax=Azohydromonas caseinilytica TaxID=2728836 RepID=A0A848FA24_9BURK|nr:hypothetical protein [Azohydromonas caseinilytica]NML16108.1 hypothetical protein [Azohydromonas caseinilytica]
MLTWSEIESTMQIEFELRLEAQEEAVLRELLEQPALLRRMAPGHLTDDEVRAIAEKALADVVARNAAAAAAAALLEPAQSQPAAALWHWPTLFSWFRPPRR